MKNNKKLNIVWIAGLAALVILILLLSKCTGKQAEQTPAPAAATEATVETTAAPEETTACVETTEETEETTAPTEETTEPTEAETESNTGSSSGSSTPGGSGGYDPDPDEDDDEDEEDSGEKETVEVPEPGTKTNPYVEMLSEYPASVTSVNIPAGKSCEYLIFGSAGTVLTVEAPDLTVTLGETIVEADENGIVTLDLSKTAEDPVISFTNTSSAEASYTLQIAEALGGKTNPEVLEDISEFQVKLEAEDADGYHYLWKAGVSGELTLTSESEGLEILVTRGEESLKLSESKDGKLTLRLAEEEEILIQVSAKAAEDGTIPALEAQITGQWNPDPGTKENPYSVTLNQIPGDFETAEIPAEASVWYSFTNGGGTILTITDPGIRLTYKDTVSELPAPEEPEEDPTDETEAADETTPTGPETEETPEEPAVLTVELAPTGEGQPVTIQLTNIGKEAGTYTLNFVYPLGARENPQLLESVESIDAELMAEDLDGYHYSWTASMDGTLTITSDSADCEIALIDPVAGTETIGEAGSVSMDVKMGQRVLIRIMAVQQEDGTYPAVKTTLQGTFAPAPGTSADNPLVITDPTAPMTISFSAGETVYVSGMFHEMIATLDNASGTALTCGEDTAKATRSGILTIVFPEQSGEEEPPVLFAITSEVAQDSVLSFAYPVGHAKNPATLILGENRADLEENNTSGFHYVWTAECDGFLTVAPEEGNNWKYSIENVTAGTEALVVSAGDETAETDTTVEVKQGEQLRILVNTCDPENTEAAPAGKVTITASFFDPLLGTEVKPILLDSTENVVNTVTVPAGQALYYTAQAEGMVLTLSGKDATVLHNDAEYPAADGKAVLTCHGADCVLVIRNDSEEERSYELVFVYPLGHRENPDAMMLGQNTAEIEADRASGYAFAWTADCAGELTITMVEDAQWQYVVENLTDKTAGLIHTSEEDPQIISETVKVKLGDEILVTVNTTGTVEFTASFVDPTLGREENPIWLDITDQVTVPAQKTMYCTAKADGMVMTLTGTDVLVTHNGVEYAAEKGVVSILCEGASTFEPPVFAITNTSAEDAICTVNFEYPQGHFMNPAQLQIGKNSAALEDGNTAGYYFQWIAEENGSFTITMEGETGWQYVINNLTIGVNGDICSSADVPLEPSQTVEVSPGDELQLIIHGYETEAGEAIVFRAEFAEAQPETEPEETGQETVPGETTAESITQ